ncbi:MAG: hypothetical protein HC812_05420 [Leptolyngbya sp. RL_3_1]|nr:hypothetical protein [Leptolyngbya sp. RL_3_1]
MGIADHDGILPVAEAGFAAFSQGLATGEWADFWPCSGALIMTKNPDSMEGGEAPYHGNASRLL